VRRGASVPVSHAGRFGRPSGSADTVAEMKTIEVFADVCCPFTHVGLRRLVARRAALGRDDLVIWVRAWPLELVNGEPLDSDAVAEEVVELRGHIAPELFRGFDAACFPTTSLPALGLAAGAYGRGERIGERVSLALRTALFEEGRDIANPAQLARIAAAADLELPGTDANRLVLADYAEGRDRGVLGSPHFFVGDQSFFCPALEIRRIDGHLRISEDEAGFSAFVACCVG